MDMDNPSMDMDNPSMDMDNPSMDMDKYMHKICFIGRYRLDF